MKESIRSRRFCAILAGLLCAAGLTTACTPASGGSSTTADTTNPFTDTHTKEETHSMTQEQETNQATTPDPESGLLFQDAFDGTELDAAKWTRIPEGQIGDWGLSSHDMTYPDGEGHLIIRSEWDETTGRMKIGGISSEGLFAYGYGYYEATVKFPFSCGADSSFQVLAGEQNASSPSQGVEINVIHTKDSYDGDYSHTLSWKRNYTPKNESKINIYDGRFHTFGVLRDETGFTFYIDGVQSGESAGSGRAGACAEEGFLRLLWEACDDLTPEICAKIQPAEMVVDSVRVYSSLPDTFEKAENSASKYLEYFSNARVGLFTHYTYATYATDKGTDWGGTHYSADNPRGAVSAEEAAALFDGRKFAQTAHDMGAEYVVFTVAHAGFNLLFPSQTMKEAGCPHKCTESSDVVQKLIDGLAAYDIPLVLYMPPNDDHDINDEDLKKMGWYQDPEGRTDFLIRLVNEIYDRYGDKIAGFWFDQGGPSARVCRAVKERNPDAVVFINTGVTANEEQHRLSDFLVSEYYGSIENCDSDTLPVHYSQVNRQIGNWWATGGKAPTDARNLYRYTVRTIAVRGQHNAGIAWSCGPYLDQTWETGVRGLLSEMGELLKSHDGIYGTVPGTCYPTEPNSTLSKDQWGVSTESPDGDTVYLHVLNQPEGGILKLPFPANGREFSSARFGDETLMLTKTAEGYEITMPLEADPIDTVIRLQ